MAKLKTKWYFIAALAVIIIATLFIPPFFGKSDDGSFYKILEANGLYNPFAGQTNAFVTSYGVSGGGGSHAIIGLAKLLGGHGGVMDIRWLGLIYSAMFFTGISLMIASLDFRNRWARLACAALAVIMFGDIGYTSLFNSFYTDALVLSALMLVFGALSYMVSREKPSCITLVVYAAGVLLLFYAGGISRVVAFLACVVMVRLFFIRRDALFKTVAALSLIISLGFGITGFSVPSYEDREIDLYSSVFYGVIYESPTPKEDLEALSIPAEYAALAGVDYYEANKIVDVKSDKFKAEFYDNISYGKIARFYITHPSRLYNALEKTTQNIAYIRQGYITNKADPKEAYNLKPEMAIWSNLRRIILPTFFVLVLLIFALVLFFAAKNFKRSRTSFSEAAIFLTISAAIYFVQPFIKSGFTSISRNLTAFNLLFDMILIIIVAWGIETVVKRREKLKDMYGVTQ